MPDSFRVQMVSGMFDVSLDEKLTDRFAIELPSDDDWRVGLIVGPSGSGKSTIAAKAFGSQVYRGFRWPKRKAIVDAFPASLETREIVRLLISVGLSSPPAWCKPYHVLSTGEQFRADLAMSLASNESRIAFDEYSSVVDRRTAQIGSAALRKSIDAGHIDKQFVAITCHRDVARWLQPDWVADMETGRLTRRRLRRPQLQLQIRGCDHRQWPLFAKHHYLDPRLNPAARAFIATLDDEPVAFAAVLNHFRKHAFRFTRLVTLPSFQGMGIGGALLDGVAAHLVEEEHADVVSISGSHPAVIHHCNASPRWEFRHLKKTGRRATGFFREHPDWKVSLGRAVASFHYRS
ncbi:GNAT family N-acetyltransferase [Blastopirellula sp. JC732]|uniref:GNAT family N-acetyltransferase n=1 Tax=Blastopirellula sediminis TaxID=2894196 RepID=A0A9X1MKU0_9BACT|nr:GNAT family N-acetyltransferase [Blastopirellula sediminis]MCC9608537.1 GNAT family N-acetyltransferase [Blastopirellula sediminis]MCC9628686.1 GNAT family N-acetyltransferase [Blastopirellula sediminis]